MADANDDVSLSHFDHVGQQLARRRRLGGQRGGKTGDAVGRELQRREGGLRGPLALADRELAALIRGGLHVGQRRGRRFGCGVDDVLDEDVGQPLQMAVAHGRLADAAGG